MANRKPLTNEEGEVRELTAGDFKHFAPFSALPQDEQEKLHSLKKHRGPQKAPTKELISIRLSQDVVSRLRASGRGWQARVDEHLREWLKEPKRKRA
ncbi:MAG: BrnA antitoxin family protein [Candidatus Korobacteraceae bacterium]